MRKAFVIFCFISNACLAQTWPSNCNENPTSERTFRNDVYKLAMHRLVEINSPYKDSILIPANFRDSISRALYAVYNMPASLLKDTIMLYFGGNDFQVFNSFREYERDSLHILHNQSSGPSGSVSSSVKKIEIGIARNGTNPWGDEWAAGNFGATSNSEVNMLVSQYGLSVQALAHFPQMYRFIVSSAFAVNTKALAAKFHTIMHNNSQSQANAWVFAGDGNSIQVNQLEDGTILTFRNACGDCPSGCTYGRQWRFKVNSFIDCSVTFLGGNDWGVAPNNVFVCERNGNPVMPVVFTKFAGGRKNDETWLSWEVATEDGIERYIIEESTDGASFYPTGSVAATVPGAGTKTYSYTRSGGPTGLFYRIRAVEKDGRNTFSKIIKLNEGSVPMPAFSVYPNPVLGDRFVIRSRSTSQADYELRVLAADGRIVYSQTRKYFLSSGTAEISLPPGIANGVYVVTISSAEGLLHQQTILVR